ncbi:FAD-dependent oxidoreductase [Sphaerisporangium rufum]|uniref:FAD-dependent oxidoreductase n=1 Tax=Sphaerisporangium rufum TaxID=1381558 RepID=A0A919R0N7_9ACTN|nr:FAD-dependent monooxygenase [Sphaerisporangium rufum]GII76246.1 FAD-dependent oxidoreductase [Sphaerisporangium rufum]
MTSARTAIVVGGGIAGPVAALALRRAGIEATVYEAYAETADGVGGMLSVAPNGLDALRAVGAEEAVRAAARPSARMVMTDGRGRRLSELPGLPGLPASQVLWRSDLYRALHDHAVAEGVPVQTGRRLVAAEETAGGVTAHFADGSTASADVLVGADGIRSTVRGLIDPAAPGPRHVPLLNFGALAGVQVPTDPETMYFAWGRRAFAGYWPHDEGTAWFANVPHAAPMTAAEARRTSPAEWLARLREVYAGDVPAAELVRHTRPEDLQIFGTSEIMPPVPHWYRGRMVLVGDAVHAPSPSSGQGAALAAESAVQLARCLRDLPDVPSAFAAYEALRRARVEKVAARAARTNQSKGLGPAARAVMGVIMPLASRAFFTPEKAHGFEQRHHIDWDAPVSAALTAVPPAKV